MQTKVTKAKNSVQKQQIITIVQMWLFGLEQYNTVFVLNK